MWLRVMMELRTKEEARRWLNGRMAVLVGLDTVELWKVRSGVRSETQKEECEYEKADWGCFIYFYLFFFPNCFRSNKGGRLIRLVCRGAHWSSVVRSGNRTQYSSIPGTSLEPKQLSLFYLIWQDYYFIFLIN
jgi:hypothetical protein